MLTEMDGALEGGGQLSEAERAEVWAAVCDGGDVEVTLDLGHPGSDAPIRRKVTLIINQGSRRVKFTESIWPAWVPESSSDYDPPLTDLEKTWANASDQARATARWIATILGVALAALIGSAPLSGIRGDYIPLRAYVTGGVGLACIALTIFLVIRVLVPQITGFEDLLSGKRPFDELKGRFERNAGILLPLRVRTFAELGGRARLEAVTIDQLERKISESGDNVGDEGGFKTLCDAQEGREKWLSYLMRTATQWTVVASYQVVKYRAGWARILGLISGIVGTALIVAAFLMPTPPVPVVNLTTYKLAHGAATAATQSIIGNKCATFRGVVVRTEGNGNLTVLVQATNACNSASITVPGKDLIEVP